MNYNVKAFKELIIKYRSITKEDIYKITDGYCLASLRTITILNKLTGFGNSDKCILCINAREIEGESVHFHSFCQYCLHRQDTNDYMLCLHHETYNNLSSKYFTTVEDLLLLISQRADYLESIVKTYEEGILKDM